MFGDVTLLYLRRAAAPERWSGPLTAEQIVEAAPCGDDCVTDSRSMPFTALDGELNRNGRLREALLEVCPLARATRYQRWKGLLFVGLVPVLVLAAMDLDLLRAGLVGAPSALAVDLLVTLVIAADLARTTPRNPAASAVALVSTALRLVLLISNRCARGVHPLLFGLAGVALLAGVLLAWLSPTPRQIADHLRRALSMAPPTEIPPRTTPGYWSYIAYALAAGAALPLMLYVMQEGHIPVHAQLLAFLLFAWIVPSAGRVRFGREPPPFRRALPAALGAQERTRRLSARALARACLRIAASCIAALVLCFGLVRGVQHGLDTIAAVQRCSAPEAAETSLQRFLDRERQEASWGRRSPLADPLYFALTVVLIPIAEELVYRGLVQHALRRRLRRRYAIGLAALVFGLAHLLVYQSVVYQTILLGVGFGLAYEGAGIVAGTLAHMLWNLWLSL